MQAMKCMFCGDRHWPRQPCPAFAKVAAEERKLQARKVLDRVTAVTEKPKLAITEKPRLTVTENPKPVTANTPVTENNPPITVTPPITVEGRPLRKRGRPPTGKAMSAAERMRRYRARRAAKATQSTSAQA